LSSTNLRALQRQTSTIPIVFALVSDPVAQGFVTSLARPGGNITGFSAYEFSMGGKWVDLLKQLVPGLARVGLLFNPDVSIQSKEFMRSVEATAPSFDVDAVALPVRSSEDLEKTVTGVTQLVNTGLIVSTDQFLSARRKVLIELVAKHRIPTIYAQPEFALDGGLISYGTDQAEQLRRAAIYVDRILRDFEPGSLPVQNPIKFKCVINLKTARALGIDVPLSLLLNADEVIE
jgi:putative ABC transport system substrate-binding protein